MKLLLFTKNNLLYKNFILLSKDLFDDVKIVFSENHPKRSDVTYHDFYTECKSYDPDVILSFYYNRIIQREIIDLSTIASANFHGSLLPSYVGSHALNWQIANGETETGVTLHELTPKIDGGKIIIQKKFNIGKDDSAGDILKKGIVCSCQILKLFHSQLENNSLSYCDQNPAGNEFRCRKRTHADSEIKNDMTPIEVCNLVRALIPFWPRAFFIDKNGKKILVENIIDETLASKILKEIADE
tara:strand:+ start:2650 stop:3378 length:729 start_codon:yes stop_codon:yes gene_type:complete